jgi:hypothetical protein
MGPPVRKSTTTLGADEQEPHTRLTTLGHVSTACQRPVTRRTRCHLRQECSRRKSGDAESFRQFLEKTLKLRVNEAKSHGRPIDQLEFLGFTFKKTSIRWSERALLAGIHAADNATHRSKLGRLHVISTEETGPGCPRMDEVFRHCRILPPHPGTRPLVEAASPDGLLETVAHVPDECPESVEAWSVAEDCYFGGDES